MKPIKSYIPMSETAYYILMSLVEERHGYAIMQYTEEITNGRIKLGAGTLYGSLSKMEKDGLITITKEESKRKYYIITEIGLSVLREEVERIKELYNNAERIEGYVK